MMSVQHYAIGLTAPVGSTEAAGMVGVLHFRISRIYTSVTGPGLAVIDGFYLGDDPDNLLMGELDAWAFSLTNIQAQRAEFLEKHGLTGKSDAQIDRYLDKHELSMPDVPALLFPTLSKGDRIRITGRFPTGCTISLMGLTPV